MSRKIWFLVLFVVGVCSVNSTGFQSWVVPAQAQVEESPRASLVPEVRQFDFWVGKWKVTTGSATVVSSVSTFGVGGIAMLETYNPGGEYQATSVTVYNSKTRKWTQNWLDSDGLLLELSGELQNGIMVLTGDYTGSQGQPTQARLTYFNISRTEFDQTFEISTDSGTTWATTYSAHYVKDLSPLPVSRSPEIKRLEKQQFTAASLPSKARDFDFWVGKWTVDVAGSNTPAISLIRSFGLGGGLAILEDYNLGSYRGTSVSVFSLKNNQWHQFWFDNGAPALLLEIDGNLANGMMDLEGDYFDDSNGRRLYSRLRYFNIKGDTFTQHFDVSPDGGKTFQTTYNAFYTRQILAAPQNFAASQVKSTKVVLSWKDTSTIEDRFEIQQFQDGKWVTLATTRSDATRSKIKKLQAQTMYRFAVRACAGVECSESAELTVTTQ
ncbi:MAG TPA: fibronectin type III domain-containing protein [Acidobacteriota bacterium]|nr:fibronectin type III domain-containing protein [Acidobacteriota bacterium]